MMKIEQIDKKTICKMHNCTNVAEHLLEINKKLFSIKIKICKFHLKQFYESLGKVLTPKGIKNIIKKGENKK